MRVVIQRVTSGKVSLNGVVKSEIAFGYVVLLGVKAGDSEKEARFLAAKVASLRVMADEVGKMNRSIVDAGGEILVVSQFTLYADISGGRRPSFIQAAKPEVSKPLYALFVEELKRLGVKNVVTGEFGAYMQVEIVNDGPVTIVIDSDQFNQ